MQILQLVMIIAIKLHLQLILIPSFAETVTLHVKLATVPIQINVYLVALLFFMIILVFQIVL